MAKYSRKDHAQEFADTIIELLEGGDLAPFKMPWVGGQPHQNVITGKAYRGINTLILAIAAYKQNFSSPFWLSFKQVTDKGGKVKKGSKGAAITYFKEVESKDEIDSVTGQPKKFFVRKFYTVFNADQVEGVEFPEALPVFAERDLGERSKMLVDHIMAYKDSQGIELKDGSGAWYSPVSDSVTMPNNFYSDDAYAAVLAHEFIHSTGHKSRLNRFKGNEVKFRKQREEYAFEEIITELAAGSMCSFFGIESRYDQHASYIDSWLKALKNDKEFIFKAASQSQKAINFINDSVEKQKQKAA